MKNDILSGFRRGQLSYSRLFLLIAVVFSFFFLAALVHARTEFSLSTYEKAKLRYRTSGLHAGESFLRNHLENNAKDARAWIMLARYRGLKDKGRTDRDDSVFFSYLQTSQAVRFAELAAWYDLGARGPAAALKRLVREPLQSRYEAMAKISREAGNLQKAGEYYQQAIAANPKNANLKKQLLNVLLQQESFDELEKRLARSEYASASNHHVLYRNHLQQSRYFAMMPHIIQAQFKRRSWPETATAILAGISWLVILLQLSNFMEQSLREKLLIPFSLILGAGSALFTLWSVALMNHLMAYDGRPGGIIFNLLYAVVGIGLREEIIKLLFFLPLAPLLARFGSDRAILSVAATVGLGFALEENVAYYASHGGAVVASRFLTANFFHMALTGYCGYYFVQAMKSGAWSEFFEAFALMAMLHGAYDFFLMDQSLAPLSIVAYGVFIWLARDFLGLMRDKTKIPSRALSSRAVFGAGLAVALGVGYLLNARFGNLWMAFLQSVGSLLGVVIIIIMFFRELDEPMVR